MNNKKLCEDLRKAYNFRDWPIIVGSATIVDRTTAKDAADLIESMQADLRHEEKVSHGQMEQNKRLRKMMDKLQANLAESQRRERAAVEDLEGAGACFTCKHFRRNGGDCFGAGRCRLDGIEIWPCNKPGVYRVEVPDDGRKMYEWRGLQEAEKGDSDGAE